MVVSTSDIGHVLFLFLFLCSTGHFIASFHVLSEWRSGRKSWVGAGRSLCVSSTAAGQNSGGFGVLPTVQERLSFALFRIGSRVFGNDVAGGDAPKARGVIFSRANAIF